MLTPLLDLIEGTVLESLSPLLAALDALVEALGLGTINIG
ncbi:hypothetical protein GCM10027591_05770 [Zhihengliuella somnathii]